ncbi:PorP/SprF family type IX secretion system membrane protein [Arenibacter echinorum]|uniref:Type IX secretion system PorP/SprF family membrane protein n=1 Tax=Arenibacter echinorum TaxID=440515 RepID=A0A327RF28_9FLAO|nr:type IX secretion system membrane protein PorP/SprF [Arenibacter echinorum]RAJ15311.1 type IX secretion system PorP/SprF family membrane protein [Arenibacter echinorum]
MNLRIYDKGYRDILLFCSLLFFSVGMLFAQKEPQYTQYMYNIGSFNPAYVGTVETPDITGLYRVQWSGIPGAPKTLRFGVNLPLANEKNGLGFNVVSDQLGPTTQTYIDLAYSFQVKISDETKLSFGVDAGGSLLDVDYTKGDFENPNEPLINNADTFNKFYPTVGAGMFMYQENWYVGLSVPNFLTSGIYADEVANIVEDKMQFNFIGGYVFDFSEGLKFKPAFLMNYLKGLPLNLNLSTNFLINDIVTLGASYRLDNALSGLAGLQISNSLFLGYSYDYNTNGLGEYSQGSHEVILKFYLGRSIGKSKKDNKRDQKGMPKQIDSPRFF